MNSLRKHILQVRLLHTACAASLDLSLEAFTTAGPTLRAFSAAATQLADFSSATGLTALSTSRGIFNAYNTVLDTVILKEQASPRRLLTMRKRRAAAFNAQLLSLDILHSISNFSEFMKSKIIFTILY